MEKSAEAKSKPRLVSLFGMPVQNSVKKNGIRVRQRSLVMKPADIKHGRLIWLSGNKLCNVSRNSVKK